MYDIDIDTDETHRSLRTAELAAHTASVIAVATTLLVVDVVPGAETNPVAAWLIAQVGLVPWALATGALCVDSGVLGQLLELLGSVAEGL
jgi:hypothetical protein